MTQGSLSDLIGHIREFYTPLIEMMGRLGTFWGVAYYNLTEFSDPSNIGFTVSQYFGSGDSHAIADYIAEVWLHKPPDCVLHDITRSFLKNRPQKIDRFLSILTDIHFTQNGWKRAG